MIDHISYSALKTWYECPRLFKLKEIDKIIPSGGSIHTAFGNAVHKVAENLLQDTKENIWELFTREFKNKLSLLPSIGEIITQKENKQLICEMKTQAKNIFPEIITGLKNYFGDYKLIATECNLMTDIPNTYLKFKGFIDLILFIPETNKYHIIDWKTTSWGWLPEQKTNKITGYQLALYKYFFCQANNINPEDVETNFALLKRTAKSNKHVEIFRVTSGKKKINNALNWIKLPIKNIENGYYPKRSNYCVNCFGREICQKQNS